MSEKQITIPVENSADMADSLFDEKDHVTEDKTFRVDLSNAVKVAKKQREDAEVITMDIADLFGDNVSFLPVDVNTMKPKGKPIPSSNRKKFQ